MRHKKVKRIGNRARVLSLISSFTTIEDIAHKLRVVPSAIYRLRNRLVKDGLLNSDYTLTKTGSEVMQKGLMLLDNVSGRNVIRLHNVGVSVKLASVPFDWNGRRERWVKSLGGKTWELNHSSLSEARVLDWLRVRTTSSSVVLYFGDVYADSPLDAKNKLFELFESACFQVERSLKVRLQKKGVWEFKTASQEFAFVKNEVAVELGKAGFDLRVKDLQGRTRLIVDASLGYRELETKNIITGEADAFLVHEDMEDLVVKGITRKGLLARIEALEGNSYVKTDSERLEVS